MVQYLAIDGDPQDRVGVLAGELGQGCNLGLRLLAVSDTANDTREENVFLTRPSGQ